MRKLIIGFDVDDVLAAFLPEVVRIYNLRTRSHNTPEDVTGWDITQSLNKMSKEELEGIWKAPWFYDNVAVIPGAMEAVAAARELGRAIFITSCAEDTEGPKFRWLVQHGFLTGTRESRRDFFPVSDKGLVACDMLLDDNVDNVVNAHRHGVLVDMPHNRHRRNEVGAALGVDTGLREFPEFIYRYALGGDLGSWLNPNPAAAMHWSSL